MKRIDYKQVNEPYNSQISPSKQISVHRQPQFINHDPSVKSTMAMGGQLQLLSPGRPKQLPKISGSDAGSGLMPQLGYQEEYGRDKQSYSEINQYGKPSSNMFQLEQNPGKKSTGQFITDQMDNIPIGFKYTLSKAQADLKNKQFPEKVRPPPPPQISIMQVDAEVEDGVKSPEFGGGDNNSRNHSQNQQALTDLNSKRQRVFARKQSMEDAQTVRKEEIRSIARRRASNAVITGYTPKLIIINNSQISGQNGKQLKNNEAVEDYHDGSDTLQTAPSRIQDDQVGHPALFPFAGKRTQPALKPEVMDIIQNQRRSPYSLMNPHPNQDTQETDMEVRMIENKNLLNNFDDVISQNSLMSQKPSFKLNKDQYNMKIESLRDMKKNIQNLGGLGNGNIGSAQWNQRQALMQKMKDYGNMNVRVNKMISIPKKQRQNDKDSESPTTKRNQRLKKFNEIMSPGASISASNKSELSGVVSRRKSKSIVSSLVGSPSINTRKSPDKKNKWRNESDVMNQLSLGNKLDKEIQELSPQEVEAQFNKGERHDRNVMDKNYHMAIYSNKILEKI